MDTAAIISIVIALASLGVAIYAVMRDRAGELNWREAYGLTDEPLTRAGVRVSPTRLVTNPPVVRVTGGTAVA